jgi:hypothetical protein
VDNCLAAIPGPGAFQYPLRERSPAYPSAASGNDCCETDETILYDFLDLMNSGDARPPLRLRSVQATGMRAERPTTPLVVTAHNRLAQLGSISYRQYRQQQNLRRMLANTADETTRKRPSGEEAALHFSLF